MTAEQAERLIDVMLRMIEEQHRMSLALDVLAMSADDVRAMIAAGKQDQIPLLLLKAAGFTT
jgi:hypothetical protein